MTEILRSLDTRRHGTRALLRIEITVRDARPERANPRTDELPLKATVAWRFEPRPDSGVRQFVVDGHWTVERYG